MKIKPAVLVGVLGVVLFVVVAYLFQAFGYWNPPGVAVGYGDNYDHDDHDDQAIENEHVESGYISDSLEGSMNLHDFLEDNGVSIDCVAGKLGIANSKTKDSAKDIKENLGIEMSDVRTIIDECMGLEARPDPHADEDVDIHEPIEKVEHDESEVTDDGTVYISDNLMGSDNIAEFLGANNISAECLAEKLGISTEELDQSAKDLKEKLVIEMTDIRFAIDDCMGLEVRPDPHAVVEEETTTEAHESSIDVDEKAHEEESVDEPEDVVVSIDDDLPQLMGSDNVKEYCEAYDIPLDCVAEKLGVSVESLDINGGKLAPEVGMDMHDMRDLILSCH